MSRTINYDLFFKGKYIGTYTAKMIAKKLDLNYEYVTLSARQGKTMKKNWKAVKSECRKGYRFLILFDRKEHQVQGEHISFLFGGACNAIRK